MATAADYATQRQQETDQSAMMTEARKALARQQAAGYPTQPLNVTGAQQPTMQQRNSAGQMGPAINPSMQGQNPALVGRDLQSAFAQQRQQQDAAFSQLGRSEGSPLQQAGLLRPQFGAPPTTLGAARPATGVQSIGQQPVVGPVTPGQPSNGGYDFGGLRREIDAFGAPPGMSDADMAKIRAQESLRLMNIQNAELSKLGAAAASSGALLGGDVKSLAADLAAQRIAGETDFGVKLQQQKLAGDQANYAARLNLAGSLAQQKSGQEYGSSERRETQQFTREEAELDRRWRSGENLTDREWQTLENAKNREQQTSERIGTQQFTAQEAELDRRWRSGERLSAQEYDQLERAKDRLQQTSERIGAQEFSSAEAELDRRWRSGERLSDQEWQTLERAKDRVENARQFDTEAGGFMRGPDGQPILGPDGKPIPTLSRDQLAQNLNIATMDDNTRRYVAELNDRYNRDLNASTIDPTTWQAILSAAGSLAPILAGLGIGADDIVGGVKDVFGGGGENPGGGSSGGGFFGNTSGIGGVLTGRDTVGGVGGALLGAGGSALLLSSFNDPVGLSRTAKSIAGGAAVGSVIPGVGTLIGAGVGAFVSAFGPGARARAKTAFTTNFDNMYRQLESQGALNRPPTDPDSVWRPENRLAIAGGFAEAVREASRGGVGDIEISDPDWQRMEGLGLAGSVQGSDRARFYAIDDPRLIAMMGPGGANKYFTFEVPHENNDNVYATAEGSMSAFLRDGTMIVRDRVTGQPIDLNNPEQMKMIAARNNPTGAAIAGTSITNPQTTPPKQGVA